MSQLQLYNSLNGRKENFSPIDETHVRVYACGPTVYNYAHIGNGRMAVIFDQFARLLRVLYPRVTYVSNITDIEDKIIDAALEQNVPIAEITTKYARIYNEDMAMMGVEAPDLQPLATEHIPEMIAQIEALIDQGHAYEAQGHVLFDVPSFENYGRLSGRSRDDQIAGARVEIAPYKKDAADFVLWKPSSENQPGWDSPWGYGRPGWHIECSAMSEKHLGLPFDIHGGGADLKFPHHENELAQSCCAHGRDRQLQEDSESFAKYWVHNGFVTVEGEKMSKSLGNITLVHDLVQEYPGEVLRMTLLSAHYRQPLDWSISALQQNKAYLDGIYRTLYELGAEYRDVSHDKIPQEILAALCDDLNTPQAFSVLKKLAKEAQETRSDEALDALFAAGSILGLLQTSPAKWLGYEAEDDGVDAAEIDALLEERQAARKEKNFARADEIRDILAEKNITIEDTASGAKWRLNK